MTTVVIGIDFGTTNSSIARATDTGKVELAHFPYMGEVTAAYRSLLYFEQIKERGVNALKSWSGPEGIEHYLSADHKGRLIQSLKSFLSSRSLQSTDVFSRKYTLEELIAGILRDLREITNHRSRFFCAGTRPRRTYGGISLLWSHRQRIASHPISSASANRENQSSSTGLMIMFGTSTRSSLRLESRQHSS
jgi:hypothetical protein